MSDLRKIRVQHVERGADGREVKTDVDVLTDADCVSMDGKGLKERIGELINARVGEIIDGAPKELDTLKEIAEELQANQSGVSTILKQLEGKADELVVKNKVDKVDGKGLSTNDYTDADKTKLKGIEAGAEKNLVKSVNGKIGDIKLAIPRVDLSEYVKKADIEALIKRVADDKSGSPGSFMLLQGTMDAGWFGEVPANEFITGDELAKLVGITAGTSQYSDEPWLKFSYMGKVEFIAKKPIRYNISWDNINSAGCVTGKEVEIKGKKYRVRLIKGKTEGKQDNSSTYQNEIHHGSEWNKLMLPIHINAPSNWGYPKCVKSPTDDWGVDYTDADLLTYYKHGKGSYCWCQEYGESTSYRLLRGCYGVSCASSNYSGFSGGVCGWRPCLEYVG